MSSRPWAEVRRVLLAALEAPTQERERRVALEANGDEQLAAEALSLLRAAPLAEEPLAGGAPAPGRVGPYRVLGELGRGGMGTVYLAVRADGELVLPVALKVLKRGMDTDEVLARFLAERQALASLDHPYIARVLDGGSTAEGLPWFAMEHIEGEPIVRWCESRRLALRDRLRLFRRVCAAVAHAHQRLIVHRDIKPENVLVRDGADGQPEPKLLDFGIAKVLGAAPGASATRAGRPWMTPAWASPEQLRGEPVGTAADVYSLGALLYALLAGEAPPRAAPGAPPPAPSARERRVPADVDALVQRALEPEVARRYRSVDELSADVERFLRSEPIAARPVGAARRARLFLARHAVAASALAGAFALLSVALALVLRQAAVAREEAAKAADINAFLSWMLTSIDPEGEGRDVPFAEVVERAAARLADEFDERPLVRATLEDTIGRTFHHLGRFDEGEALLSSALATRRAELGARDGATLATLEGLAEMLYDRGAAEEARAHAAELVAARGDGGDALALASALNLQGLVSYELGEYALAEPPLRRALELRRRALGDHEDVALCLNNVALVLDATNRPDEALELSFEAIEVLRRASARPGAASSRATDLATLLYNTGCRMYTKGDLARARAMLEESAAIRVEALGEGHAHTALVLGALGGVLLDVGEHSRAEELVARAAAIQRGRGDEDPLALASALYHLGKVQAALGSHDAAIAAYGESQRLYARPGESSVSPEFVDARLAEVLLDAGRHDEALARCEAQLARLRDGSSWRHPGVAADALTVAARAHLARGEEERARESLALARAVPEDERTWRLAWTELARADLAEREGRHEEEVLAARRALEVLAARLPVSGPLAPWLELRLARALAAAGRHDEAGALLEKSCAALEAALPPDHPWRRALEGWCGP